MIRDIKSKLEKAGRYDEVVDITKEAMDTAVEMSFLGNDGLEMEVMKFLTCITKNDFKKYKMKNFYNLDGHFVHRGVELAMKSAKKYDETKEVDPSYLRQSVPYFIASLIIRNLDTKEEFEIPEEYYKKGK